MHLKITQSTPASDSIAQIVQANYGFGEVVGSELLRRSFNQVYRLDFTDGRRVVARLCAERPRGGPNLQFEAEALEHWARSGCRVSRCLRASSGEVAIRVALPEGERALILFEFLDGEATGDATEDIQAFGRGLASLHVAGDEYRGAPSLYTLDLDHLLWRPLQGLIQASTMTAELRSQFEALATRLHDRIIGLGPLSRVLCHGDAHGYNNFVVAGERGERIATFFDFDEAGPGFLAHELAVYPWHRFPRVPDEGPSERVLSQWRHFIGAYRQARAVPDADLAAIAPFMAVHQFWLMGEYAGRIPVWGSQTMSTDALRRLATVLSQWEALELPI
jgi:Ser/Thr protein kinase RdoA (MazF antagonist)